MDKTSRTEGVAPLCLAAMLCLYARDAAEGIVGATATAAGSRGRQRRTEGCRIYGEWVATLDGYVNAQIQPQVTGYLIKQDYREGSFVHKGDVLFEIDPRPFQAVLDMAKAQLAQAEAQLGNASLNVKRDIPEAQVSAIPHSQLETDTKHELAGKAPCEAAQAAVEQAKLNLGFTKVRSLISGIAGIAQVQVGNLVTSDDRAHSGLAGGSHQGVFPDQRR